LSTRKGVSEGLILDLSSAESTTAVKATGPSKHLSKLLRAFSVYDALASFAIGYKPPFWSGQNTEVPTYFVAVDQEYRPRKFTDKYRNKLRVLIRYGTI